MAITTLSRVASGTHKRNLATPLHGAMLDAAYRDGATAHRLGRTKLQVPERYAPDSALKAQWMAGWISADIRRRGSK